MSNQKNDWMERLAKNYKLPENNLKKTKKKYPY